MTLLIIDDDMSKRVLLLLFVVLGCALYCALDRWFIYDIDDYAFSTITECTITDTGKISHTNVKPVDSFADALNSQIACYKCYNGRFVIHTLVQWLCGTQPAWVAVVWNTIMWGVLIVCLALLCCRGLEVTWGRLVIPLGALWVLMPAAARMFLSSVTSAADYLWTGAATMLFLLIFTSIAASRVKNRWSSMAMTALMSLIAGAMQESFSIGISAGLLVYVAANRSRVTSMQWTMTICYILGTALCCMAPANFLRSDMMGHRFHVETLVDVAKYPIFSLMLLTMLIAWVTNRQVVKDVVRDHVIPVVAMAVNLAFAVVVAYTSAWQLTCVALCSTILLCQLLYRIFDGPSRIVNAIAILLMVATISLASMRFHYREQMWHVQQEMFDRVMTDADGIISVQKAFDIDRPYKQSRLAPIYRLYTKNFAQALINNDQGVGNYMLSCFLTNCSRPFMVKAVLPDSPERIEAMFATSSFTIDGISAVKCDPYVIVRRDGRDCPASLSIRQRYEFNGVHYDVCLTK